MIFSVRCHAAVMAGAVHKNVVITYDGTHAPSRNAVVDSVVSKDISILPFTAETHSTVDYNGIAVIGLSDIPDIRLTLINLSETITRLADMTAENDSIDGVRNITFYSLG